LSTAGGSQFNLLLAASLDTSPIQARLLVYEAVAILDTAIGFLDAGAAGAAIVGTWIFVTTVPMVLAAGLDPGGQASGSGVAKICCARVSIFAVAVIGAAFRVGGVSAYVGRN